MLSEKMQEAINEQINAELYSAYLYLSMAAQFESMNMRGFATWMRLQSQEETMHAIKFYDYVISRGGRVVLKAIEAPPAEWDSPLDAFQAAQKHEQKVTGLIHSLVDLSEQQKDHATRSFLQWFVDEQVEEEAAADEIVGKLTMMKDAPQGLLMLDGILGKRKAEETGKEES